MHAVHQADAASMRPYARPGQRQHSGRSPFVRADDSLISWRMAVWNLAFWTDGQVEHVRLAVFASRLHGLYVCVVRMFDRRRQHSRAIKGRRLWLVTETREGSTRREIGCFTCKLLKLRISRRKWQLHVESVMRRERLLKRLINHSSLATLS